MLFRVFVFWKETYSVRKIRCRLRFAFALYSTNGQLAAPICIQDWKWSHSCLYGATKGVWTSNAGHWGYATYKTYESSSNDLDVTQFELYNVPVECPCSLFLGNSPSITTTISTVEFDYGCHLQLQCYHCYKSYLTSLFLLLALNLISREKANAFLWGCAYVFASYCIVWELNTHFSHVDFPEALKG